MLEVKNVSYAYKTKKDKTILNNVSATFVCYFRGGYLLYHCRSEWCRKNNTLIVVSRLRHSGKRDCPLQWRGHYKKRAELPQKA